MTSEIIPNKSKAMVLAQAKMTELKLFSSSSPEDAQQLVNEWLQQNAVEIQHVGQSQSEKNGRFVFVISLFYQRT